jgi:hypothetical protein
VVLGEQLLVDARLVVEALQRRLSRQLHEVLIAGLVLRQATKVVAPVPLGSRWSGAAVATVQLAADDRLDARRLAFR